MKVKSAHETAGIGKGHKYLGHFAQPKYINRGHNSDRIVVTNDEPAGPRENVLKGDEPVANKISQQRLYDQMGEGIVKQRQRDEDATIKAADELRKQRAAAKRAEDSSSKNMNVPVWNR
jgi:hypothetical protein